HDFHLAIDICNGLRPAITEDTPECWSNIMQQCWHPDPSQRPTIKHLLGLNNKYRDIYGHFKNEHKPMFEKAEEKRNQMIELGIPFVKDSGKEHSNANYTSDITFDFEDVRVKSEIISKKDDRDKWQQS
ncbi:16527_t:CDS:2, partial [Acaulospora morrowiae]